MHKDVVIKILDAVPVGEENAKVAADIGEAAGLGRRSAGTRLNAIRDGRLCSKFDVGKRQNLWWRSA